ncbi:unnamed protein product, partial [Ixodes pacificus]
ETHEAGGVHQERLKTLSSPANVDVAVQLFRRDRPDLLVHEPRSLTHSPGGPRRRHQRRSRPTAVDTCTTPVDVRLRHGLRPSLLQWLSRTRQCPSPATCSSTAQTNTRLQA